MQTSNYSYKLKSVKNNSAVKTINETQPIQSVQVLQDVTPLSFAKLYHPRVRGYNYRGESANSLADLILSKSSRDNLLDEMDLNTFKEVPILDVLSGYYALMKKNYLNPIKRTIQGEQTLADAGKEIVFNSLNETSEDLNILSNIVKSQMAYAGGELFSGEKLKASLGIGTERQTFNFNTGNWLEDVALEMISDPITWITVGIAGATSVAKSGATSAAEAGIKQAAVGLTDEAAKEIAKTQVKQTLNIASRIARQGNKVIDKAILEEAAKRVTYEQVMRSVSKKVRDEIVLKGLKNVLKNYFEVTKVTAAKGYREYLAAVRIKNVFDTTHKTYANAVRTIATPYGATKQIYNLVKDHAIPTLRKLVINMLDKYDLEEDFIKHTGNYKALVNSVYLKNQQMFEQTFKDEKAFILSYMNITPFELQTVIQDVLQKNKTDLTDEELIGKTIYALRQRSKKLNDTYFDFDKKMSIMYKNLKSHNMTTKKSAQMIKEHLDKVITAASVGPRVIDSITKERTFNYAMASIEAIKQNLKDRNILETYKYIDETLLQYGKTYYGLAGLEDYLARIIGDKNIPQGYKKELSDILMSYGINLETAKRISRILHSNNIKNKEEAIRKVLDASTNTQLGSSNVYDKTQELVKEQMHKQTNSMIDEYFEELSVKARNKYNYTKSKRFKNVTDAIEHINKLNELKLIPNENELPTEILGYPVISDPSNEYFKKNPNTMAFFSEKDGIIYINPDRFKDKKFTMHSDSGLIKTGSEEDLMLQTLFHEYTHSFYNHGTMPNTGILEIEQKTEREAMQLAKDFYRPVYYLKSAVSEMDLPLQEDMVNRLRIALNRPYTSEDRHLLNSISYNINTFYNEFLPSVLKPSSKVDVLRNFQNKIKELERYAKDFKHFANMLPATAKDGVPGGYTIQLADGLREIAQKINNFINDGFKEEYINYIEDVQNQMTVQLMHKNMFDVLVQNTHLSNDAEIEFALKQLSNKESYTRKTIVPLAISTFERTNRPAQALTLKKVIAQIDTVQNISKMLTAELDTSFDLPRKTQDTLKRILYDVIDNNSNMLITDVLNDNVMPLTYNLSINNEIPKTYKEYLRDTLFEQIDFNKSYILRTVRNNSAVPLVEDKAIINEVKYSLSTLLDDYINSQSLLLDSVDNVTLSVMYGSETVTMIKTIKDLEYGLAQQLGNRLTEFTLDSVVALESELDLFAQGVEQGLLDIEKANDVLEGAITYEEAKERLNRLGERFNLYNASIESNKYATRYYIKNKFNKKLFLFDNTSTKTFGTIQYAIDANGNRIYNDRNIFKFNGTNAEFKMLTDKLAAYQDILHEPYKYEEKYLNTLRGALVNTYMTPNVLFGPTDPTAYFAVLEPQALLTWEVVTKSASLSAHNKTLFYKYYNALQEHTTLQTLTKADIIAQIDEVTRNNRFMSSADYSRVATIAIENDAIEYANRVISGNLMESLHDVESLGKYKDDLVKFFKDDVEAHNDITKTIMDIRHQDEINADLKGFTNAEDAAKLGLYDYGYEPTLQKADRAQRIERTASLAMSFAKMEPIDIAAHLRQQSNAILAFYNNHIIRTLKADGSVEFEPIKKVFNFTPEELKEAGLKMMRELDEEGNEWIYFRLIDDREYKNIPKYLELSTIYKKQQQAYTDLIDKYRIRLNMYETKNVPSNLIVVETINRDTFENFMDAYKSFFGDAEERKLYQNVTPQGNSKFFSTSFERINLMVVGGYDAYNIWNKKYSKTFIPHSEQMSINTLRGLTNMVNRSNKINKALTIFYNQDMSISESPVIQEIIKRSKDEDIERLIKQYDYKAIVLRKDKQGLPLISEYPLKGTVRSIVEAGEAGGILVPRETYEALALTVNNREMSDDLLDLYRRVVPSTYKSMYLFTLGFPFRNAIDSLLYKNLNEEGIKVLGYEYEAHKALKLHSQIQKEVFDLSIELYGPDKPTFNKELLLQVLSKHTKEEANVYFLTDLFRQSSASGGLSESLADFLNNYNKLNKDDIRPLWEKVYEENILFGKQPLNPLAIMRNINDDIEQTARFGLFLASVDNGYEVNEAIKRVIDTHFNYKDPDPILRWCEDIFWFSTFPINNFSYYVKNYDKSPILFKFALATQTASWNNGEYTYEELKKTNFLAYHAMQGNIRIGNVIIKVSPSLFDFFNLAYDGLNNIKERLNPFLAIPIEKKLDELNPLQTQFRNWHKFVKGESLIPSIYTKINTNTEWWKKLRKNYIKNTSKSWTKYPKRILKPNYYRVYAKHYYGRDYYRLPRKISKSFINRLGGGYIDSPKNIKYKRLRNVLNTYRV